MNLTYFSSEIMGVDLEYIYDLASMRQEVDILKSAGNMYSSYYKWKMAITCNRSTTLCATFVPCYFLLIIYATQLLRTILVWYDVWRIVDIFLVSFHLVK